MKFQTLLATALAAAALPVEAVAQCPEFPAGEELSRLTDDRIDEASGLARSWVNDGLFWTHNDSGDSPRLFVIDEAGATRTVVTLNGATAVDWEDIAIGPCEPNSPTPCVWVGDFGDNNEERDDLALYRFPEPTIGANAPDTLAVDAIKIPFGYEGGARNAETLMVHPTSAAVFVVDKTVGDPSNLWSVPTDGTLATMIATASLGEVGIVSNRITGGDFAPSGDQFSIRTYTHIYTFCGADPAIAFESTPTSVIGTHLFQSEALTYSRDGGTLYTTTEVQRNEQPQLLAMVSAPPTTPGEDVGTPPSSDVGRQPDTGRPVDMMRTSETVPEVTFPVEESSGCSCGTTTASTSLSGILLGLLVIAGLRRRR